MTDELKTTHEREPAKAVESKSREMNDIGSPEKAGRQLSESQRDPNQRLSDFGRTGDANRLERNSAYDQCRSSMDGMGRLAEDHHKNEALAADKRDGTHIVEKHGPENPNRGPGSRFDTYGDLRETREAAERQFLEQTGRRDMTEPPRDGDNHRYAVHVEHGRDVANATVENSQTKHDGVYERNRDDGVEMKTWERHSRVDQVSTTTTEFQWDAKNEKWSVTDHRPEPDAPKYSERTLMLEDGQTAQETRLQKTYEGTPVNNRSDAEGKKIDDATRREKRKETTDTLPTDEMSHLFAQMNGPAIGESLQQAAGDKRALSAQSWTMNRGAGSPWAAMERDINKYRAENPDSKITIAVTERFIAEKRGDRHTHREVTIIDADGKTPEQLRHWTVDSNLYFMNPQSHERTKAK